MEKPRRQPRLAIYALVLITVGMVSIGASPHEVSSLPDKGDRASLIDTAIDQLTHWFTALIDASLQTAEGTEDPEAESVDPEDAEAAQPAGLKPPGPNDMGFSIEPNG